MERSLPDEIVIISIIAQTNGGVWCFNNSLLKDQQFIVKVNRLIQNVDYEMDWCEDIFSWLEKVKERIKRACINYSKHKSWQEKKNEKDLRANIDHELQKIASEPNRDLT